MAGLTNGGWARVAGAVALAFVPAVLGPPAAAQAPVLTLTIRGAGAGSGAVVSRFETGVVAGTCTVTAGVTSGVCELAIGPSPVNRGGPVSVSLEAFPLSGSIFGGWAGAGCSPTGTTCTVGEPGGTVTATFNPGTPEPPPTALDWGDAPDKSISPIFDYKTRQVDNGARHSVELDASGNPVGPRLGALVDVEADGQPTRSGDGDDSAGTDDEDGVTFKTPLVPGATATIDIAIGPPGTALDGYRLLGWVDFDGSGSFETGENILDVAPTVGVSSHTFAVPNGISAEISYARFRLGRFTAGAAEHFGLVAGGEVEDYRVPVGAFDMGDAPDSESKGTDGYQTLLSNDGAAHLFFPGSESARLGACVDAEGDGQPSAFADLDDRNRSAAVAGACTGPSDDDGVANWQPLVPGGRSSVDVTATGTCEVSAWIDFNRDGDWTDPAEMVFGGVDVVNQTRRIEIAVPSNASPGPTYARFRCNSSRPGGEVRGGGEVEDYLVSIEGPASPEAPPEPLVEVLSLNVADPNELTFRWGVAAAHALFGRAPATNFRLDARLAPRPAPTAASIPIPGTESTFTVKAPNGRFFVTLAALNTFGETLSKELDVTVPLPGGGGPCATPPDAPTNLTAQVAGGAVTLNWTASTGCPATTYVVRAGTFPGGTNVAGAIDLGGTNPQFFAPGVPSGRYYVRVAARNGAGDSADSNEVIVDIP